MGASAQQGRLRLELRRAGGRRELGQADCRAQQRRVAATGPRDRCRRQGDQPAMNNVAHDGHVQSYQNLQQSQQYAVSNIGPPTLRNRLEAAMRQVVEARYYAVERNDWNLERLLQHADS